MLVPWRRSIIDALITLEAIAVDVAVHALIAERFHHGSPYYVLSAIQISSDLVV